jgi:hypothetical protein
VQCAPYASQLHVAETFELASYLVAGGAAVTSAVLFLTLPTPKAAHARAWCTPALAGMSCGYAF